MFVKRGLSGVVTTLIIVLLVLVAIGVIWMVVRNVIDKGAEQIELGQFSLDLQIKKVQVQNGNVTVIVVRRNPGEGNFVGMNFVFSDGQNSETIRQNVSLQELDEKTFTFTLTKISASNLKTVSVAPIYELSSGKETAGNTVTTFEVPKGGTGTGTGGAVSGGNFAALGFSGTGKQEYSVSSQSADVVKFTKAVVDPVDVLPGDNQTFIVHVYSPYVITNATSITELDNSTLNLNFEKIGTDSQNSSIEIWSVSWIVNDTHNTEYRTKITAIDSQGNSNSITLTWTDSCQSAFTHNSDVILSASCTTTANAVEGIDVGSLTLGTDVDITLAVGSQLIFNSGKSINITASGASIIATSGGSFGNSNLFYYDSDGDNAATNATLLASTSSDVSGALRAWKASGTSDCNPTNGSLYSTGYGANYDNDGYGLSASSGCNNGIDPFNATTGGNDCNDGNSSLYSNGYGTDSDGDGYGLASVSACNNGASPFTATTGGDDCDDANAGLHTNPGSCTLDGDCCPGYACGGSQCNAA